MSRLTWKMMGLAAVVAGSAQLATMGAASALVLQASGQPTLGDTGPSNGKALQVDYKKKKQDQQGQHRQYDRHRDGNRYSHRRNGYTHHYGGYWYASPWWVISVPRVVIPVPLVVIQ